MKKLLYVIPLIALFGLFIPKEVYAEEPNEYTLTIGDIYNGQISVDGSDENGKTFKKGENVTVNLYPDNGYNFCSYMLKALNGETITQITNKKGNTDDWSIDIIMPSQDVIINFGFGSSEENSKEDLEEAEKYTIPNLYDLCNTMMQPYGYADVSMTTKADTKVKRIVDEPKADPITWQISKEDVDTGKKSQGDARLDNAIFKMEYFENMNGTTSGSPKHTWYYKTRVINGEYVVMPQAASFLADGYTSDPLPRLDGKIQFPLGTYRISEIKSSDSYLLNGQIQATGTTIKRVEEHSITAILEGGDEPQLFFSYVQTNTPKRGGFSIKKSDYNRQENDSEANRTKAQGDATNLSAKFNIINRSTNPVVVNGTTYAVGAVCYTFTTTADGTFTSNNKLLPYGTYEVKEVEAPTGYLLDPAWSGRIVVRENETIYPVISNGTGVSSSNNQVKNNYIKRGGFKIQKRDAMIGGTTPQGKGSFDNIQLEIVNNSTNAVYVDGRWYQKGEVCKVIYTDSTGYAEVKNTLPYGSYIVREKTAGTGYFVTTGYEKERTSVNFSVREDGEVVDLTGDTKSLKNLVKRGDFSIRKIDSGTQDTLSNVKFKITSDTTGESHEFTTDENGYYSSSSSWNPHTQDTNGGTKDSGLWFGTDQEGNVAEIDNDMGALPYDIYTIEELPCEANTGYTLITVKLIIYRENNYLNPLEVSLNNAEDSNIVIGTTAKDEEYSSHYGLAEENFTLIDTVNYMGLTPNEKYTLLCRLIDRETGEAIKDEEGNEITGTHTFTAFASTGATDVEVTFDATKIKGKTLVCYEYLFLGETVGSIEDDTKEYIAKHAEIDDSGQTIYFPGISTVATDADTTINVSNADDMVNLVDTVSYMNLQPGKKYSMTATLMDKETGEAVKDSSGNKITESVEFTPTSSSGEVEVPITFNGVGNEGKTYVFFEELSRGSRKYAVHEDINDEAQSIHFPKLTSDALNEDSGLQIAFSGPDQTLTDTIHYENVSKGYDYTVKSYVVKKSTGEKIENTDSENTFHADDTHGDIDVTLSNIDLSDANGDDIVLYADLYYGDELISEHHDINDERETIRIPEIKTMAKDNNTLDQVGSMAELTDTVSYKKLVPGIEYTVYGTLMDKETGEAVKVTTGMIVGNKMAEPMYREDDTTYYRVGTNNLGITEGYYTLDEENNIFVECDENGDVIESTKTVSVDNMILLLDTAITSTPDVVYSETTFTPEEEDGSVDVVFSIEDSMIVPGHSYVFYEYLAVNDKKIAEHTDIDDESQTIHYPDVKTNATDENSGTKSGTVSDGEEASVLVDSVSCNNLIVGKEYTIKGKLMDKDTKEPYKDKNGEEVTAVKTFTAEEENPTIELKFEYLSSENSTIVVFEDLYHNNVLVATHSDLDDEDQTEYYPEIKTTAIDKDTNSHQGKSVGNVTIVDTVEYKNLVVGQEYEISGILMDKDKKSIYGLDETVHGDISEYVVNKKGITATTKFIPEKKNGTIELSFTFEAKNGGTIVVFEDLRTNDKTIFMHEDLNDIAQTVYYPKVRTTLTDKQTKEHVALKSDKTIFVDTVAYENTISGNSYVIEGYLVDKEKGEKIKDTDVKKEFKSEGKGTVDVEFTVNTAEYQGKSLVAYETLLTEKKTIKTAETTVSRDIEYIPVAEHKDVNDTAQTVYVMKIGTTASVNNKHEADAEKQTELIDIISYENLVIGKEYTVKGTLMDKDSGQSTGITSSGKFTPTETKGEVKLTFAFDSTKYTGKSLVAFEEVYLNEVLVADHKDINDANQTVKFSDVPVPQTDDIAKHIIVLLFGSILGLYILKRKMHISFSSK